MGAAHVNLELQHLETSPLLMDHSAAASKCDAAVSVNPGTSDDCKSCHSMGMPTLPQGDVVVVIDQCDASSMPIPSQSNGAITISNSSERSISSSNHPQPIPVGSFSQRAGLSGDSNEHAAEQSSNFWESRLWLVLDLSINIAQIMASIIVLSLSRNERPRAPLALWVMGYACGCFAMLPVIYWRYKPWQAQSYEQDRLVSPSASATSVQGSSEELERASPPASVHYTEDSRFVTRLKRYKIALDCFFAVWFVIGSVWIFGGHTPSNDAPNLYRLCVVFLAFSCISYAMPLVICATVCCCLPCIITVLSYREERTKVKGAAPEVIAGLPVYKFKTKEQQAKECKDGSDSDSESNGGGVFAPGTEKERVVSGEDAVCCICLGQYKDGVDLKELQCTHFFHVQCVDKWLNINGTCPLCKQELPTSTATHQP